MIKLYSPRGLKLILICMLLPPTPPHLPTHTHTSSKHYNSCSVNIFHGLLLGLFLKYLSGKMIRRCDACPNNLAFYASLEIIQVKLAYRKNRCTHPILWKPFSSNGLKVWDSETWSDAISNKSHTIKIPIATYLWK